MNPHDSAREVAGTDWITAAMAGRGSDIPSLPATGEREGKQVALAIAWFIVEIVAISVITYAADAAFWPLTK